MSISKNVFGLALGTMLLTGAETSLAATPAAPVTDENATEEVLFKIHDITPIKNSDGEVIACDFNTTFYNRSPYEVTDASLDFTWSDEALENIINEEKVSDANKKNRNVNRAYSETERRTSKNVSTVVELSGLKSYNQVTVSSRVNTDRCFLLVGNIDFTVKSCSASGGNSSSKNSARRASRESPCAKMFKFVAPSDAQYHLAFKEISLDEEKKREEAKKMERQEEISDTYAKTVDALNVASGILGGIK